MSAGKPRTKFVVTCEHASHRIPAHFLVDLQPSVTLAEEHRVWDPGARSISAEVARNLKAPCCYGQWTRLLVDLNRSLDHRHLHAPPIKALSAPVRASIVRDYYQPFREEVHRAVQKEIDGRFQVIHLSVHSFVPIFGGHDRQTEFALLYDPARRREQTLARNWLKQIRVRRPDWRLRSNFPYRGTADGHVTALRRIFDEPDYLGIELEFSQALPLETDSRVIGRMIAETLLTSKEVGLLHAETTVR